MKILFVWDFHGVLENGNDFAVLEITNQALQHHGLLRRMTEEECVYLSGRKWHEYFAYLLPEASTEVRLALQTTCFEISLNRPDIIAKYIRPNDYAAHVLERIHNTNHKQILISNTSPTSLDMFITSVGLEKYFPASHRFGADSHIHSHVNKQHCLDQHIKSADPYQLLVTVGDSPGDMTLSTGNIKTKRYLYSHPSRKHREALCDHKISDLRMVLQELENQIYS